MRGFCCWCFVLLIATELASPGAQGLAATERTARDLFEEGYVPRISIELSREALEKLRGANRKYVSGTVREGDTVYTNVSIRLKGGPGSFRPIEDKPALTLNFARLAPGQKFHGLKKLHLNNSVQDSSYLGEKVSRELFEAADVPVARAGHCVVEFNGRPLGFYVLIEGINKPFLKRYFKDPDANLYDGHSQSEVTRNMEINSGDSPNDYKRLRALATAAREPDLAARAVKLEETLDVNRFLSFLATEVMLCHWDGYAMNRNNFRIYHDRDKDRMVFLPQGVDQVFQRQNTGVFPPMVGLVARSVLEVPDFRQRYRDRMAQLLTNVWQINRLTNRVQEIGAVVQSTMAEVNTQGAAHYGNRITAFNRRLQQRVRLLERELLSPATQVRFDSDGLVVVPGWQPKVDIGSPVLKKETPNERAIFLYVSATENSAASWRSRVTLSPGRYRFHGRMRISDVELNPDDPKSGVGLRISRQKFTRQFSGTTPWTTVTFDFETRPEQPEVELVCELRAANGEAWFDEGSLRLIRIEQTE